MHTFVALLRGINVGGRNAVPMRELRAAFEDLGHEGVQTYIQSGNVLFRSRAGSEREIVARAERHLARTFGLEIAVILRASAELTRVVGRNPFLAPAADLAKLHVVFLAEPPSASARARLDPKRSPPDAFSVLGREIYLHCPNGFGRSKLTIDYFERWLGIAATARNWRTVTTLAARAQVPPQR